MREALAKLEALEQVAATFNRKALKREEWFQTTLASLSAEDYGKDVASINAAIRREDGTVVVIEAFKERLDGINTLVDTLVAGQCVAGGMVLICDR